MEANKELLTIISNETINSLSNMGIVTPSIYTPIFSEHAANHNTDIQAKDESTLK